jgi:Transcriptional regulators
MTELDVDLPQLGPIMARGLGDDVYDALLDMLTSGDLEPSTPLAIDRLAKSLSVSPTPVREALARLEHTGLVIRVANRGYRVAPPMSARQMTELVDARLVLESGALERAMRNHDQLLVDLEHAFMKHTAAAASLTEEDALRDLSRVHAYYASDWAFHQAILDACGNRYINRAVNEMSFSVHRMRQTIGRHTTDAPIAIREHSAILEAVRKDDLSAATAALTSHLQMVATRSTQ